MFCFFVFFFKQKTAYEMRISDWSSDVCSSDLAATIETLVAALKQMLDRPDHEVRSIGTRHGEKLFESLLSREERAVADDIGDYFRVPPDGRDLNYDKFFDQGEERLNHGEEYNSHNTHRLDVEELKTLMLKLPLIHRAQIGKAPRRERVCQDV